MLTCSMMRFMSLLLVAVTVMRVLLFGLHVCLLKECDGARLMAMLVWGWMRCGCGEYMGMWVVHVVQ